MNNSTSRNIAIIAQVYHGKTTPVCGMLDRENAGTVAYVGVSAGGLWPHRTKRPVQRPLPVHLFV
jgi:hypothetical protein